MIKRFSHSVIHVKTPYDYPEEYRQKIKEALENQSPFIMTGPEVEINEIKRKRINQVCISNPKCYAKKTNSKLIR